MSNLVLLRQKVFCQLGAPSVRRAVSASSGYCFGVRSLSTARESAFSRSACRPKVTCCISRSCRLCSFAKCQQLYVLSSQWDTVWAQICLSNSLPSSNMVLDCFSSCHFKSCLQSGDTSDLSWPTLLYLQAVTLEMMGSIMRRKFIVFCSKQWLGVSYISRFVLVAVGSYWWEVWGLMLWSNEPWSHD